MSFLNCEIPVLSSSFFPVNWNELKFEHFVNVLCWDRGFSFIVRFIWFAYCFYPLLLRYICVSACDDVRWNKYSVLWYSCFFYDIDEIRWVFKIWLLFFCYQLKEFVFKCRQPLSRSITTTYYGYSNQSWFVYFCKHVEHWCVYVYFLHNLVKRHELLLISAIEILYEYYIIIL